MTTPKHTKLVRERDFLAEVEVRLVESEERWGPDLSLEDVQKLDDVRLALRRGDIGAAMKMAKVYRLTPVTAA
jgi:hypothetical protein